MKGVWLKGVTLDQPWRVGQHGSKKTVLATTVCSLWPWVYRVSGIPHFTGLNIPNGKRYELTEDKDEKVSKRGAGTPALYL
jgi:hypothetical protein